MGVATWIVEHKYRCVVLVVLLLSIGLWVRSRASHSVGDGRRDSFGDALFERPDSKSSEATGFTIRIGGKDPFNESLSVAANKPVTVESVWPPSGRDHQQVVEIVLKPIPEASPTVDSEPHIGVQVFMNYDSIAGVSDPEMQFPAPQDLVFPCDAGTHEMSVYLRRFPRDAESAMPQNLLLGTTRVLVVDSVDQ